MKKVLALLLALSMLASMSVAGFATEGETIETGANEQIPVAASYEPVSGTSVISADVSWDEMNFAYIGASQGEWDADSHSYINGTAGGWTGKTATISVTNHSNTAVTATLSFCAEVPGIVGTFSTSVLELPTAENTEVADAPNASAQFGVSGAAIDADTQLGTITVTLARSQGSSGNEPGGGDAAPDATTFAQLQAAVSHGGVVRLGGNIDTGEEILCVDSDIPVVIDLNGFSLTSREYTTVLVFTDCTIRNGTVSLSGNGTAATIKNQGTVTIQNCTVISNGHYPLFNSGSATVTDSTLTGARFGDTICNQSFSNPVSLTLGGTVLMSGNIGNEASECTITVLAGTYNFDPTAYVDGSVYTVTNNGDGTWTVE